MNKVLFVGTHDIYRSKFASLYFNSVCRDKNLRSRAFSVGFVVLPKKKKANTIANPALDYLGKLGIVIEEDDLRPTKINEVYLNSCEKVVCMNMEEHLTLMRQNYPLFVRQSDYWHYPNENDSALVSSLPLIQKEVDHLIASLEVIGSSY